MRVRLAGAGRSHFGIGFVLFSEVSKLPPQVALMVFLLRGKVSGLFQIFEMVGVQSILRYLSFLNGGLYPV